MQFCSSILLYSINVFVAFIFPCLHIFASLLGWLILMLLNNVIYLFIFSNMKGLNPAYYGLEDVDSKTLNSFLSR